MLRQGTIWTYVEPLVYLTALIYVFFYLVPAIGGQVRDKCFSSYHCSSLIRRGFFGYPIDLSDGQHRDFRSSIPLIAITSLTSCGLQTLISWTLGYMNIKVSKRLRVLAVYHVSFGLIFLFIQHKYHMFVVLFICLMTYVVALLSTGAQYPLSLMWFYAIFIMLFKECYRFKLLRDTFPFVDAIFDKNTYGGMYGWQFPANFLVLRIISFSGDYIRCLQENKSRKSRIVKKGKGKAKEAVDEIEKDNHPPQDDEHITLEEYNLLNMLAYLIYAPLYIAGPIISFNNFIKYLRKPQSEENVFIYAIRWCGAFLLMETMCTYFPFFAVINSGLFRILNASEIAVVSYMTLKMMWLKFLLIWRLFRIWALLDGIAPPENMVKCMSNNYSLEGFWRGWHSSFNKWILSYMYVPMGGKDNKIWSVWIIFLFVAIWHDLEIKLIAWGLLNSTFLVIEVISRQIHASQSFQCLPNFLKITAEIFSGASFISVLIGVNMVGYAVGLTGTTEIVQKLISPNGAKTMLVSFFILLIGVCIMRYYERFKVERLGGIFSAFEATVMSKIRENTTPMEIKKNDSTDGNVDVVRLNRSNCADGIRSRSKSRSKGRGRNGSKKGK